MDTRPEISVIIPVYNAAEYLDVCLRSVMEQDFDRYEVLLIDDGSADGSSEICDRWAERYGCIEVFHNGNSGAAKARNFGLDKASGDYIIFLDADDYWCDTSALSSLFRSAKETSADIVRGEYVAVDSSGNDVFAGRRKKHAPEDVVMDNCRFLLDVVRGEFFSWLSLYSAKVFDTLRLNESLSCYEDMDLAVKLFSRPLRCVWTGITFYAYRKHRGSLSSNVDERKLSDSFGLCRTFHEYSGIVRDRKLRHYYHRYSVMMYYWTLLTLSTCRLYGRREEIIHDLELEGLRKDVFSWFLKDFTSGFSLVFFMSPASGITYLRVRSSATLPVRKILRKFRTECLR